MLTFHIPTMTCGGCAKAVTRAIQTVDPDARVEAEPARRAVKVASTGDAASIVAALQRAGYPPEPAPLQPAWG